MITCPKRHVIFYSYPKGDAYMNTLDAIKNRRSIRKYKKGAEIPMEDIKAMLEAAMLAPSARNCRPWEFTVIRDRDIMTKIMDLSPYTKMMETASLAIVVCGRPVSKEGQKQDFWQQDCGAAIENLLLSALELGYGTCWCGLYPSEDRYKLMQELIDTDAIPMAVIAVGEADEEPSRRGFYDESKVRFI